MRFAQRSFALLLIAAVSALSPVFGGEGHVHGGAGHAHGSPNGGIVTTIGSNHAEWVFNAQTGKADLYILGEDESKAAPIEAADVTAQVKVSGKDTFVAVKLIANALQGEKPGQASRFSGQAPELIGASGMEVAIQIPIGSKKHRAKFEWKPGMTGHGDHGHAHAESGPATLTSTIVALKPLATGSSSPMILKLADKAGKAVKYEDLEVVHTQRIHLLIVDASLTDYQHIHPEPTEKVGEYKFDFTPAKAGTYKLFADLLPLATKKQEYSTTTFDVPGTAQAVDRTTNLETTVGDLKFTLTFDRKELKAGEALAASVVVTGRDGQPFAQLEPVMGAFAHAVAFDEKRESTVHIHPLGREPEKSTERGGPKLDFHMKFDEPGFWKLYIQVQVNNKDVFAPFGLQFGESGKPRAVAKHSLNNKVCPITGKPVHSMQAGAHLVFKETRVELCCNGCEKSFLDDADALFKKAGAGLNH
ncbi:hypothetical protein QQ056_11355 [Oscillatoria laete-virens NRMC-F 0139]|nr:hypothetical protein [Oscillatoria laete-virens]MDL5054138.1 hypothetical protein [Oscillatoria laete-virens NRMC-F 0139]